MKALIPIICAAWILTGCDSATSMDAGLTWTLPTTNEDGTELTDGANIRVYRDQNGCNTPEIVATLGWVTSWQDLGIPGGASCYFVTALDTSGNESAPSNTAFKVNDVTKPASPSGLGVN